MLAPYLSAISAIEDTIALSFSSVSSYFECATLSVRLRRESVVHCKRAALPAGKITRGDLLSVHPFGNVSVLREYTGREILAALEHGVAQEGAKGPRLLQTAGLRYEVDSTRPAGSRVLKAEVQDEKGTFSPLEPDGRYIVALADYLAGGGTVMPCWPEEARFLRPRVWWWMRWKPGYGRIPRCPSRRAGASSV